MLQNFIERVHRQSRVALRDIHRQPAAFAWNPARSGVVGSNQITDECSQWKDKMAGMRRSFERCLCSHPLLGFEHEIEVFSGAGEITEVESGTELLIRDPNALLD